TWKDLSTIASDAVHHHCEGAIVLLKGGEIACVMRENNHQGYPSYVSFSNDEGRTWSQTAPLPFSGDRPYARQLRDGRVLVTYRNQLGNKGTQAWLGDPREGARIGYQAGGVHYGDEVSLSAEGLRMHSRAGAITRYLLMPPQNFRSDVLFDVWVRAAGPPDEPHGAIEIGRLGVKLDVLSNGLWLHRGPAETGRPIGYPDRVASTDKIVAMDMTAPRGVRLEVISGRLQVSVDGKPVMHWVVMEEVPLRETYFGRVPESGGEIWWQEVRYETRNETEPAFVWHWRAADGKYPDQYQIDHCLDLRANPPHPGVTSDHGYSSWIERTDGSIYFVDYSNRGDPPPLGHLYSLNFSPKDFEA
ncbi:MAG: glycoside hydrolase, partial [Acidobacteriota bacterium]|nr:glycoside hydrolase [Acidobacteriota bacterium]